MPLSSSAERYLKMSGKQLPVLLQGRWNNRKTFLLITLLLITITAFFRGPGSERPSLTDSIRSDGRGYYAYLPALFIFHDLSLDTQAHLNPDEKASLQVRVHVVESDQYLVNKYFTGVSILLLPFFLTALIISYITGIPADGYSWIFQVSVSLASLTYLLTGLHFLRKLLLRFVVSDSLAGLVIFIILFGTNLLYYAVFDPSMSHVYSFAAISVFLFSIHQYVCAGKKKYLAFSSALLALIILIRPTNMLVLLLVPFLTDSRQSFLRVFRHTFSSVSKIFWLIFPAVVLLSVQITYWYSVTGKFIVWSYQGEGFYFTRPAILKFLLSFQKGWLIYTPLIFFSITGWIFLMIKNRWQGIWVMLFLVSVVYVSSSWWNWYYGDGFGQRVMIDFYPLMAVLLLLFMTQLKNRIILRTTWLFIFLMVLLNLFQTWQYINRIIHPFSMDFEKYSYVFMSPDKTLAGSLGADVNIPPYGTRPDKPLLTISHDFEDRSYHWKEGCVVYSPGKAFSGNRSAYLDTWNRYSPAFVFKNEDAVYNRDNLYANMEMMVQDLEPNIRNGARLILEFRDCFGYLVQRDSYPLNAIPENEANIWRKTRFGLTLPRFLPGDNLTLYIWNPTGNRFLVDDFRMEIYGQ